MKVLNPKHPLRILFFINGSSPSDEELFAANDLPGRAMFRNASAVPESGSLEDCDAVTALKQSDVPKRYADKFPTPEVAIAARKQLLEKLRSGFDDEEAPNEQELLKKKAEAEAEAIKNKSNEKFPENLNKGLDNEKPPSSTAATSSGSWSPNVPTRN